MDVLAPMLVDKFVLAADRVVACLEGLSDDDEPGLPLEHGGRQRSAIELVRKFGQIKDPEVRAAIAGLVKTIVDRAN